MCGICGFYGKKDSRLLEAMANILAHRGPDDSGFYEDDLVSLGHRRLSIIDLSKQAQQPMSNEDKKIWLAVNGEIYNYKQLRQELIRAGHTFKSTSDSEVIVHAYEECGEDFVLRLEGMFACAIWDKNNGKLVLARDRLGIKPLYYSEDSSQLIFSSEIKAILMNKDFHKEVNNDGLNQYLAFQCILTNQTMFKGIFKLEPGHILVFKDGQKYKRSYWSIEDSISPLAQEDILKTNLISAVGSHLVSDVPLGVLLSGGLDSSSIVAIMHELRIKDINTFTVGFSRPDDEFKFGRLVAERFKTRHQEILIQPRQLENLLEKIAWHMDEPLADGGAIATYLASGRIKEFVKVVLVGEGGDEALGGYNWHKLAAFPFNLLPRYYRKKIYQYLVTYYKKRSEEPMRIFLELFPKKKVFFDAMALFELKNIVSNSILMKVDKMTMAHSLEARVPFLDHNFLSCALGLSFREKVSFKTTKKVLRKLMKDKLPLAILKRKKHGFLLPVHEWLEKDLRNFAQDILISNNRYTNSLVGNQEIRGLFKRRKGFALVENSSLLWRLLIFELWYKVYFKQG